VALARRPLGAAALDESGGEVWLLWSAIVEELG